MKENDTAYSHGTNPESVAYDTFLQLFRGYLGCVAGENAERQDAFIAAGGSAVPRDCYVRGFADGASKIIELVMTGEMELVLVKQDRKENQDEQ
jgi:hypothetical protein